MTTGFEKVAEHREGAGTAVEEYRLHNGLHVLVWEDHRAPIFSFQTWFGVGSRHERLGRTGMAHLFEHLMFKATKNMGEGEFDQLMERHGAQTNAATWVDWTYYREKLPAGNLELVVRLEADRDRASRGGQMARTAIDSLDRSAYPRCPVTESDSESDGSMAQMSDGGLILKVLFGVVVLLLVAFWNFSHVFLGEPVGGPCMEGGDCRSGECLSSVSVGVCTESCGDDDDCDDGNRCVRIAGGRNCVPQGTGELGDACDNSWDCASLYCVTSVRMPDKAFLDRPVQMGTGSPSAPRSKSACAEPCGPPHSCPEGASCRMLDGSYLCVVNDPAS